MCTFGRVHVRHLPPQHTRVEEICQLKKCLQAAAGAAVHEARLSHVMRSQPQTYCDNQPVSILPVVTPSATCCPLSFYRSTQFVLWKKHLNMTMLVVCVC